MQTDLSPEDLGAVLAYVNGEWTGLLPDDAIKRFRIVSDALERKLHADLLDAIRQNGRLQAKMKRLEIKQSHDIDTGEVFSTLPFDSLDIARALHFLLQKYSREEVTPLLLCHVTFLSYAGWLESKHERICSDGPQAYGYTDRNGKTQLLGPVFFITLNHFRKNGLPPKGREEDFERIRGGLPGLAAYLDRRAAKCARDGLNEAKLCRWLVTIPPYRNALPENNGGKWSKILSDGEIYRWKQDLRLKEAMMK